MSMTRWLSDPNNWWIAWPILTIPGLVWMVWDKRKRRR
jgi:hypothetical protein